MNNQTGGLFGGLIIISMIGVAVVWTYAPARAAVAGLLTGTPAPTSGAAPNSAAPPPASATTSGGWGTVSTPPVQASTTQPYQLVNNPLTGVGIQTAAAIPFNEAAAIPLPSITPLAPTSPSLAYA